MNKLFSNYLNTLLENKELSSSNMQSLMHLIMKGELTSVQIAGCVIAMKMKKESIDEIAAAALVMREHSNKVLIDNTVHLVDTCGTGGDSLQTFNVSTISAIIASAAGASVAKHGGRSVSSACGSADVLEALGVNVNLNHQQLGALVNNIGIGFMFAPNYHPAMKYVAPVRKELGVRSIFNLLGPLTNPAGARQQIIGVYDQSLTTVFAQVLQKLGSDHVMIVHGEDGMDEISITGKTYIAELKNNKIREYEIEPALYGIEVGSLQDIIVKDTESSKAMILDILSGSNSVARNITLLNAGAAIYVSGLSGDILSGIERAREVIDQGIALDKLNQLVSASNE
mgnify:CR=1 FL=1